MFPFPREFFGPISGMFQDAAGQQSYRRGGDMRQGRRRQRVPGDRRMAQFKEPFDSEEDFMATDSDEEAAMQFMHDVMMQDQQSRQQDRRLVNEAGLFYMPSIQVIANCLLANPRAYVCAECVACSRMHFSC